jgi:hypothetical protein
LRVRYFVNNHTTVLTSEKTDKKPD